ncbi:MAG: molecular chaperone HtpG [Fusobacteriia bacterium 4572_132]|nr:MAG: molecular chaperone HtpG [Fusobacteriia bacterium 4572_132]
MIETKNFQAETTQLLDLVIHSIYTHRDIFLRELISNASDAIDKIKFESLKKPEILENNDNFEIFISLDKENDKLTLSDNGIGMTYDEVVENIGTIAKSGSKAFMEKLKEANTNSDDGTDIIGQFGIGFYSAFMVAKKVTLITKAPGENKAVKWVSEGTGSYTIDTTDERSERGTTLILELRNEEDERGFNTEELLNESKIESLIKTYSDYIRYPINMNIEKEVIPKDADGKEIKDAKPETVVETKTLNSMTPLWKKSKSDLKDEDYNEFYKSNFHDFTDPLEIIHSKVEGNLEYTSLLFIPSRAPFDFYSKDFARGLKLYSKNVFIMENSEELLPEHFRFVKGLVDSSDLSLNVSREILQSSKQLKVIAKNVEKKVTKSLEKMLEKDRDKYEKFWKEFGTSIKSGIYSNPFTNKEKLQDLLIFNSSESDKMTTLAEYVSRMKEGQDKIYYVTGKDQKSIVKIPQMEQLKEKGYEVLYLFDKVDEFAIEGMRDYDKKEFKSITRGELDLGEDSKEEKKKTEELAKDNAGLIDKIKENLKGKVTDVKLTNRLKSSAVCLVSDDNGISMGMEQIMSQLPEGAMQGLKASKVLEINPEHPVFNSLQNEYTKGINSDELKDYSELLYEQALLIEGFELDDPVGFANKISNLMVKASK